MLVLHCVFYADPVRRRKVAHTRLRRESKSGATHVQLALDPRGLDALAHERGLGGYVSVLDVGTGSVLHFTNRFAHHVASHAVGKLWVLQEPRGERIRVDAAVNTSDGLSRRSGVVRSVRTPNALSPSPPLPRPPPRATIAPPAAHVQRRREGQALLRSGAPSTTRPSWRSAERGQHPNAGGRQTRANAPVPGRGDGEAGPVTATRAAATAQCMENLPE
jgi:hypothetical protein